MDDKKPKNEQQQKKVAREDKEKGFPPGADNPGRKEDEIRHEKRKE